MSKEDKRAYKREQRDDGTYLMKPLAKNKDHNFLKLSIVLTDRENYMNRTKAKNRQGQMILDYLYFDVDYNKDIIKIDRKAIRTELGLSTSGIKRGIDNLLTIGYIIKTSKRGEYLINSDLFFKGVRTTKQKETAVNNFNTYIDNRTFNLSTKEAVDRAKELGFGITKHTKDKYIE